MSSRLVRIGIFTAMLGIVQAELTYAQVKSPKPPEKFDVQIRYRIAADRNERVLIFEDMSKYFASLGFVETPHEDNDLAAFDISAEFMNGTIPSKTALRLLENRRVQTVMLQPEGFKLPEDGKQRVRINLILGSSKDQLLLFKQTLIALRTFGFQHDLGYDTNRYTLMIGTIPTTNLPKLIRDLRLQPSGWVLEDSPSELVQLLGDGTPTTSLVKPFADTLPIRVVEVKGLAEAPPAIVKLPPIPADQPSQEKLTADLRRKLVEEGVKDNPLRVEVVLTAEPSELDTDWRSMLIQAGVTVEGRIGSVVSITLPTGSKASEIAALSSIVSVRLPRSARVVTTEAKKEEPKKEEPKKEEPKKEATNADLLQISADELQLPSKTLDADPLANTNLHRLHAVNRKGQGVHVVIIDTDFAGWETRLTSPKQGANASKYGVVQFIDLTAERQRDLTPDEMPGEFGLGTQAALTVRLAAPLADITLVRVPVDAPYQLINIARFIRGDLFRPDGITSRRAELGSDIEDYQFRRKKANEEYRAAFANFDEAEPAEKRRRDAQKALVKLDAEDKELLKRLDRIEKLEIQLNRLKGAQIVVGLMSWNTGFAFDAASPMSRFLDDWLVRSRPSMKTRHLTRPNNLPQPLWFQPAGDQRGQSWTGLFQDTDGNGVMEFGPKDQDLLPGRWSRELNFIGIEQAGKPTTDLPNGGKIRVSIQWREPHDPELSETDYRTPIAPIKLQIVRQRDPQAAKSASDEIDLIAESEGAPERLQIDPNFGIYEHSLEITLPSAGRYALRIEGTQPKSLRPASVPTLVAQEVRWELRPRLFIESADGSGKYSLLDYSSKSGGVPVPGDARGVITVGASAPDGTPRLSNSTGAGTLTELAQKPTLLAPDYMPKWNDEIEVRGSAIATSFAAGLSASLLSAGVQVNQIPDIVLQKSGGVINIPDYLFKR